MKRNSMCRLLLVFLGFSAFAKGPRVVYPPKAQTLRGKSYKIDITSTYSSTLATYDVNGTEQALNGTDTFSLIDTDVVLSYGYSNRLQFDFGGRFRQLSSDASSQSNSNTGMESFSGGFKYTFSKKKDYIYALSGKYSLTPYSNQEYSPSETIPDTEQVLGDSGQGFEVNLIANYFYTKWTTFEFTAGYSSPPNDLSAEAPYDFRLVKNYNKWAMWFGLRGVYSFGQDTNDVNPQNKIQNATGGVTARFNSINRSYNQPYAGIRYLFSRKYRASLEAGQTMSGSSTDKSMDLSFNLFWITGGKSKERQFEERFKEYTAEATVIKVSPRGKYLKIDKGLAQDVTKGSRVDIYKTDFFGGNVLIASGIIYESGPSWAIVRLQKKYRNLPIEKGLTARVK